MRPTPHEIEVAAYHRWQRRGGSHGHDRDDWNAAEKDLAFARKYRYVARHKLSDSGPVLLGKPNSPGRPRRCRFCERSAPSVTFRKPLALPRLVGNTSLVAWDECDECRDFEDSSLRGPFESFARPMLGPAPAPPRSGVPVPALKALVRMALSIMPPDELHHFGDTVDWVFNPDHAFDASLFSHLGCLVYLTPAPVARPFASLARRNDDEAPTPYMVFFLGTGRVVFQTALPLCPRDEDLSDADFRGPELSMSAGDGPAFRASRCDYLPASISRRTPAPAVPAGMTS